VETQECIYSVLQGIFDSEYLASIYFQIQKDYKKASWRT